MLHIALYLAAKNGHTKTVRALLHVGIPTYRNGDIPTCLFLPSFFTKYNLKNSTDI